MKATLKKRPAEIQQELTPSLETCVRHYLGESVTDRLANPVYFFENTLIKGPLEDFLRDVFDGMTRSGPRVLPLRIGFGFGKTHAQILTLHALLAPDALPEEAEKALRTLGWDRERARRALVLPLDFFDPPKPPFPRMAQVVRAYADERTGFYRGEEVAEKVREHMDALLSGFLESDKFSDILTDIATATKSPVLVMVDELGFGFVKRAERFLEAKRQGRPLEGDPLAEVHWLSAFLTTLAGRSEREGFPLVIIYAWAEQDAETLRYMASEDERISNVLGIVGSEVGRLSRYTGGMEEGPLGLNPDDMLVIAVFRILSFPEEEAERTAEQATNTMVAYGAVTPAERGVLLREIKRHYPLSPALARALGKFARRQELPGAEHVRSAIYALSLVAERALYNDPHSPLLDVKHMTLEEASFLGYMGDLRQDWASLVPDLAEAINFAEPRIKGLCEHIAKLILAKAATANTLEIERAQDIGKASIYGVTQREILCSLVCTASPEKLGEAISGVKEALTYLISRSGRIEERIINGERFYFPTILGTVFGRLRIYITDEEKTASEDNIGYLERSKLLADIISKVKIEGCSIYRMDFDLLHDPKELRAKIGPALNEPHPAFVLVEPWNPTLTKQMHQHGGFSNLVSWLVNKMNEPDYVDVLGRPYYLIALLPNIERSRVEELIRPLLEYEATTKFLDYLERKEDIIKEMVEKALSSAAVKRVEIPKREIERIIRGKVSQEIEAARSATHSIRLKAAREAAVKFLNLFDHYVAYSPAQRAFALQDLSRQISATQGKLGEITDPSQCADAVGAFFNAIVSLRYVRDVDSLERAVLKAIQERVSARLLEPLNIEELVESFIQGAHEAVPLSGRLLRDAIQRVDGVQLELPDKEVTVEVREEKISFRVISKERPVEEAIRREIGERVKKGRVEPFSLDELAESIAQNQGIPRPEKDAIRRALQQMEEEKFVLPEGTATLRVGHDRVEFEIEREQVVSRFSLEDVEVEDEMRTLASLIKDGEIRAQKVEVKIEGREITGHMEIRGNYRPLTVAFNALSAIARGYDAKVKVHIALKEAVTEGELRKVFSSRWLKNLLKKLRMGGEV